MPRNNDTSSLQVLRFQIPQFPRTIVKRFLLEDGNEYPVKVLAQSVLVLENELPWDGRYIGCWDKSVIVNEIKSKPYSTYTLNLCGNIIHCTMHPTRNLYPCIVDELAEAFGQPKIGTHSIRIKGKGLLVMMRNHESDGAPPLTLDTYMKLYPERVNDQLRTRVEEIFSFRALMGLTHNIHSCILMIGDRPASYRNKVHNIDTFSIDGHLTSFSKAMSKRWSRLFDPTAVCTEIIHRRWYYCSTVLKQCKKTLKRIDPELTHMSVFFRQNVNVFYRGDYSDGVAAVSHRERFYEDYIYRRDEHCPDLDSRQFYQGNYRDSPPPPVVDVKETQEAIERVQRCLQDPEEREKIEQLRAQVRLDIHNADLIDIRSNEHLHGQQIENGGSNFIGEVPFDYEQQKELLRREDEQLYDEELALVKVLLAGGSRERAEQAKRDTLKLIDRTLESRQKATGKKQRKPKQKKIPTPPRKNTLAYMSLYIKDDVRPWYVYDEHFGREVCNDQLHSKYLKRAHARFLKDKREWKKHIEEKIARTGIVPYKTIDPTDEIPRILPRGARARKT